MDKVTEPSSNLNQNLGSQNSNTIRLNNNWKRGFYITLILWILSLFSLIYTNNSKKIARQTTININSFPTPISVNENSTTFKPTLISTKEYKNKTIGIFSFNNENEDAENMLLYRNYIIAIVKDKNPFINVIPGYISTSLFEGQNVRLCENCFDISEDKILVINGETNSISIYEGGFLVDGSNYFTNLKTIALPYDSKEVGNLISVKCKDSVCKLESTFRTYLSCSYDFNLAQNTFSGAACGSLNGGFVPTKL